MKRFKVLCVFFSLLIVSSAFAGEAPIRISAGQSYNQWTKQYRPQVVITSVSNSVIIKNMIVNKGNCKYDEYAFADVNGMMKSIKIFPKKLPYGKKLKINVRGCDILSVDVETNKGDWSVEY